MNLRISTSIVALAASAGLAGSAHAQLTSTSGFQGSETLGAATPRNTDTGVKLSEDTLLHIGIGAEAGYDSNVFYEEDDPTGAPLVRVTPSIELTNQGRDGSIPSGVFYNLAASLQYREYLADDPNVRAQRAFNPSVAGNLEFSKNHTLSFSLSDQFSRVEDPPYMKGDGNITRDYNVASAQLRLAPGGGRIQAVLRYTNAIDIFETREFQYANSMGHELMLDASWRWFPKTALFLSVAQGYITYLNPEKAQDAQDPKYDSYPLRVMAGLRGLITEKLSLNVGVGYAAGFYQGDVENPSGLGNLAVIAEAGYRLTILTQLLLGYRHEFRNSVIGNYYNVDVGYLLLRHQLDTRLQFGAFGRYENRRYEGVRELNEAMMPVDIERQDDTISAGAQFDYFVQRWFYTGIGYSLAFNESSHDDTTASTAQGFDYIKHQVFARLGVVY